MLFYVESLTSQRCLEVLNLCMKEKSCKQLMDDMERKCENIHTWNEYSEISPTCSEDCFIAVLELFQNPIGAMWKGCDCRVPQTQSIFSSLSKNAAFEEQCFQYKRNHRTSCRHKYSCKGI